jgi:hypothetical protein
MLSILQGIIEEIYWQKTHIHNRWYYTWYNDACKRLGLKHHVYGNELKNIMERLIQNIKDRTQNVLMIITLHINHKVVIESLLPPITSKCLFYIYI